MEETSRYLFRSDFNKMDSFIGLDFTFPLIEPLETRFLYLGLWRTQAGIYLEAILIKFFIGLDFTFPLIEPLKLDSYLSSWRRHQAGYLFKNDF
jgi:hypothetical protein